MPAPSSTIHRRISTRRGSSASTPCCSRTMAARRKSCGSWDCRFRFPLFTKLRRERSEPFSEVLEAALGQRDLRTVAVQHAHAIARHDLAVLGDLTRPFGARGGCGEQQLVIV